MPVGKKSDFITPRSSSRGVVKPVGRVVTPQVAPERVKQDDDFSTKPAPPDVANKEDESRSRLGRKKD